jgi:hypothetical protein
MITLFMVTLLVPLPFTLPAFFLSRRKKEKESSLLPFVHIPAITLWFLLFDLGYGAETWGNLSDEVSYLVVATVLLTYLKVFVLDRFTTRHAATTYCTLALLTCSAFLLRALMPSLTE